MFKSSSNTLQKYHPFYLVTPSPWPFLLSISVANTFISIGMWFHESSYKLFFINLINMIWINSLWWRDIIRESTYLGNHTLIMMKLLRFGMILFIISEILLFTTFFWSYFHMALSPSIEIGSMWPPKSIKPFNPYNIPLLNTIILLSSGITITWAHYMILSNNYPHSVISLKITILLGMYFSILQSWEYYEAPFCLSDSVYGSTFFMLTGLHGLHVIIGTLFISITLIRLMKFHFSSSHHFNFEASSWYWHFVDVIWLLVYISIYWWFY